MPNDKALENYHENGILTKTVMMQAVLLNSYSDRWRDRVKKRSQRYHKQIKQAYAEVTLLETEVSKFDTNIWLPKLLDWDEKTKNRGHSGTLGDIKILTYSIAGRWLGTFTGKDADITVITATGERNPMMGIQSLCGKFDDIRDLIRTVTAKWDSVKLKTDTKIGVM